MASLPDASGRHATGATADDPAVVAGVHDGIAEALKETLAHRVAQGKPDGFKDELRHHADVRARWFLFRSERLHEVMDAWMESNKISPATPPPWK